MKNHKSIQRACLGVLLSVVPVFYAFSCPVPCGSFFLKSSFSTIASPPASTTNITICNNQLPYHWNGLTCLTAGIYSAMLVSSTGADSTAILNLSVINVGTSITNAIICDDQLPYVWNGNTYSTNGTYSVTLTSSSGCDSVPILSLTVNHVVSSTTNHTVCSNQLPYTWNGNNYPAAGTYTVTLTSAAGCDSIATLNLVVKPVAASTTNITICASSLPYNWNGNSYPSAGSYSVTLIAANGCDSVATLNLSTNPNSTSNTLVDVCSNQLPYTWNGSSYIMAGNYSAILTGSSGCDSVANLSLAIIPVPISTTTRTICPGQLPYTWNGNSYAAAGNYSVTLMAANGCDSMARLRLIVTALLTSSTDIEVCNSGLPYTWNGNNYVAAGTYTAAFTTAAGCDSVATLNLTVNSMHTGTDSVIICDNQLPFNYHGHIFSAAGDYAIVPSVALDPCHFVDSLNLVVLTIVPSFTNIHACNNNLPFIWNGNSYNAPGMYSIVLTSAYGCDSTANLDLEVGTVAASSTTAAVCSSQTPYGWNGNNYNVSGTYSVTLSTSLGCDSVATLNLMVNPVYNTTVDLTICQAQIPYTWNGNTYSATGIYPLTLTSSGGCDSVVTLRLTVLNFLTSTTNVIICNNQLPYSWNGNSYSAAGIYTSAFVNSAGCDSVATLNLSINPVITSSTLINTCTGQLPFTWNGNSYSSGGIYSVTLLTAGGCDSVATLNLVVHPVETSISNITICNNQLPYTWNGNSYPLAGTYPVTLTGSSGCDSIATLELTVTDILTSTTNVNVCPSQLPYSWNGNSYPDGGTYSVTLNNSAGCDSVPILSLTVVPYVESTTDLIICNNELPYQWNGNTYAGAGTYSVLLSGSGCDSLATLNLAVLPAITSTTNVSVCASQLPYSWNGNSYSSAGVSSLVFTAANGCDSVATLDLIVNPLTASTTSISICNNQLPYSWNGNNYGGSGIYSITLTGSSGCDSVATLNLVANPVVSSSTDLAICISQLPYTWNGNSYISAGTYTATLTSSSGCDSIATLHLSVNAVLTSVTNVITCISQLPYSWNGSSYSTAGTYHVTLAGSSGCDSVATLNLTINPVLTSSTNISTCNNQLPYTWNGNNYLTTGVYTVILTGISGCDSIATLNLLVNTTSTGTATATVCDNELPYQWNGNTYIAAGIYPITLTGSSGCDSVVTLTLDVNPVAVSSTSAITCNNQLPYSWNGNSYNSGGDYTVVLNGSSGCDSIATLHLTVKQTSTSITSFSTCTNQLPYSWNGQQFSTAGTYVVNLVNAAGCDSIATLNLIVNPVTTSNTIAGTCINQLPYTWNGQSFTTPGLHSVTLVSQAGCDSVATLDLIINPVPVSTTNANTCTNQLPYSWNSQSYQASGTYSATLTSAAGCDSIATLQLTVSPVAASTTAAAICSAALPYNWNGQQYNTPGLHSVTLTSHLGCDSVATLNLTINITPPAPAVTSPVVYCQFEGTSALEANITSPGNHLLWYLSASGGTGSLIAPIPSSSVAGVSSYYVSQVNGSCEGPRALITVTVNSKPYAGPNQALKICFGKSANLAALFNTSGYSSSWTNNGQQVEDSSAVTVAGTYQLVVANNSGCRDTALVNLQINPLVTAFAGADDNAEYNAPYQLMGLGTGGGQYQWSPAAPLNNPFIASPLAILTHDETFVLMVSDDLGCAAFDTVKLRVLNGPTFYVPTAFTPNGDGLNDIFRPTPIGIESLEFFRVYNRYGELVYETHDLKQGWDGQYRGVKQNIGNYVWYLKGTDRFHKLRELKGNVVLIR